MQKTILEVIGLALILSLSSVIARAQDKSADQDKMKMSMPEMMKDCNDHMQKCQASIDEAIKAEDAGKHDDTKMHLKMAKDEMTKCQDTMKMMMDMKHDDKKEAKEK